MKKVFIKTHGCQMNVQDSQQMYQTLEPHEYVPTETAEDADLIILNTCTVRDKPEQKVYSELGMYAKMLRQQGREAVLAVGGCVAQQEGQKLLKRAPYLDLVFGTHQVANLPALLAQVTGKKERVAEKHFKKPEAYTFLSDTLRHKHSTVSSYVTIAHGCNKFCSFCVVPFVRGKEISRSSSEILAEARKLANAGIKELILLGQTVNAYGKNGADISFAELLDLVSEVDGIERIRFTSPHPAEVTNDLIACYRDNKKICKHMHLPVQSGSDSVLEQMGRGYTRKEYLEIIAAYREAVPDISFSSDVIVGFPGETEEDFSQTLSLLEEVAFDTVYAFTYSPRPFTKAAKYLTESLSAQEKDERLQRLLELQDRITERNYRANVGKTERVLIDGLGRDGKRYTGRSDRNRIVHVEQVHADGTAPILPASLRDVRIVEANRHSLMGELLQ